jgi:hypothetical protein
MTHQFGRNRARAWGTARARASLQVSLRLATADLRQASNCPPPGSTLTHCCRRWALHSLSDRRTSANLASVTRHGNETSRMCSLMQARRLPFPGGIPVHRVLRSATQCPTANLSCAVAFDGHNNKMAPIIRAVFTTEGPPTRSRSVGEFIGRLPKKIIWTQSSKVSVDPNQLSSGIRRIVEIVRY